MTKKSKLKALVFSCLICAGLALSTNAKTLHSYEFPKDYTEEEGITDGFKFTNGFHACIDKGKLSAISTFGMPVTFISPEFSVEDAKYFVFSFKSQMAHDDSTIKVTIKTSDGQMHHHELKLIDNKTNLYALALPLEQQNVTGFEITPQVKAEFTDMYGVELDFARFIDSKTFVSLKIGNAGIFDGEQMRPTDSPALILDSRTLTPARCVAEALGAKVDWDDTTKTVTITKNSDKIKLFIGRDEASINSILTKLDVAAQIIDNRTYTPARFVAEALGYSVEWDDNSKTVIITGDKITYAYGTEYSFEQSLKKLEAIQPKAPLDDEVILTIEGMDATASEIRYATIACASYYSPEKLPDETTQATIDKETLDYFALNSAVVNISDKLGIKLTAQEFEKNIAAQIEYYQNTFGSDYEQMILEYTGHTPYSYFKSALFNAYFKKLTDSLYGQNGASPDKANLIEQAKQKMANEEYVRAKHILIQFNNDEQSKKQALEEANNVLSLISQGYDFDMLMNMFGQDPGVDVNPDGYYFTKGEMVKPFEECTYSLGIGQVSGIVETDYGYHIIQRLPLEADNAGFFNCSVYQALASQAAQALITAQADTYSLKSEADFKQRQADFLNELYGTNN